MKEKTIVVGDIHGDWGKLNKLIQQKEPRTVLQCGDFGWWPALECRRPVLYGQQSAWKLRGVKPGESTVLWCDGNHEDHWDLRDKGEAHYPRVTWMPRGSTFGLPDGRTVMFIGGADSIDKQVRTLGVDWFPEEVIRDADVDRCLAYRGRVDIIISHTCPVEFDVKSAHGSEGKHSDPSRKALSVILERFKPDLWFFGHWHKWQKGTNLNTRWECLDYPGHGGKWWTEI